MHLLARSQGVAVLANAFRDKSFVQQEVRQLCEWLESCARKPATSNR
jgi:TetR/AcrR family transcriptional repressor of nem operon